MYTRSRPNPRWVNQWRTMYVVAATLVVLGFIMVITAADVHSPSLATFSIVTLFAAFTAGMVTSMVHATWLVQQPINGRVVERYTEVSGFTREVLPLNATLDQILDTESVNTGIVGAQVLYWLYVAPFNGSGLHRFLVTREVFDAHTVGDDYDAANPATTETPKVLVRSVPAEQRVEREQVDERVEHEERVN